jgi:hypothetical protein
MNKIDNKSDKGQLKGNIFSKENYTNSHLIFKSGMDISFRELQEIVPKNIWIKTKRHLLDAIKEQTDE